MNILQTWTRNSSWLKYYDYNKHRLGTQRHWIVRISLIYDLEYWSSDISHTYNHAYNIIYYYIIPTKSFSAWMQFKINFDTNLKLKYNACDFMYYNITRTQYPRNTTINTLQMTRNTREKNVKICSSKSWGVLVFWFSSGSKSFRAEFELKNSRSQYCALSRVHTSYIMYV